jgi:hypothetical protein
VIKRVSIVVEMPPGSPRKVRRFKVRPQQTEGKKLMFTEKGVETVINDFVENFSNSNPTLADSYRLVVLGDGNFKLVWTGATGDQSTD